MTEIKEIVKCLGQPANRLDPNTIDIHLPNTCKCDVAKRIRISAGVGDE